MQHLRLLMANLAQTLTSWHKETGASTTPKLSHQAFLVWVTWRLDPWNPPISLPETGSSAYKYIWNHNLSLKKIIPILIIKWTSQKRKKKVNQSYIPVGSISIESNRSCNGNYLGNYCICTESVRVLISAIMTIYTALSFMHFKCRCSLKNTGGHANANTIVFYVRHSTICRLWYLVPTGRHGRSSLRYWEATVSFAFSSP